MIKRFVCAALTVAMAATLFTGCVKVVKIGEEGKLTGETTFDASASVDEIWEEAMTEIDGKAVDIAEVLTTANGNLTGLGEECSGYKDASASYYNYAVKTEGATITAIDKDSFYGTMTLSVPGYEGDATIEVQIGSGYKGSAIRDSLSFIKFADFTNQTEWGQINKTLLEKIDADVVQASYEDLTEGATIDLVGCFTADSANEMLITPVSITVN